MTSKKYISWLVSSLIVISGMWLIWFTSKQRTFSAISDNWLSVLIGSAGFIVLTFIYNRASVGKFYGAYIALSWCMFMVFGLMLNAIILKSEETVTFNIVATIQKNDVFQVFYIGKDDSTLEAQSVKQNIKGSNQKQIVSINLPDTFEINKIRFDLGCDSLQKNVMVSEIYLSAHDQKLFLFKPSKNINYFSPNEFVTFEKDTWLLKAKAGNYDPFISTGNFTPEYKNLLSEKKHLPFPFFISFIFILAPLVYLLFFSSGTNFKTQLYGFTSCLFVALLFFPSLNETFHFFKDENAEKRNLTEKPVLSELNLLDYPKLYEAYYNDHFGFRVMLAQLGGKIRYHIFGSSAILSKAAIGKEGWMFLNGDYYNINEDLTKSNLYSPDELKQAADDWQARKAELWKDSIRYYKAFWPDKHYVYPEFLPFHMKIINKDTIPRCDQAINYLRKNGSSLKLIDIRSQLLKEKNKNRLFLKHDSHWNSYGGFIAYTELMKNFSLDFPELKPHPINDYHISNHEKIGGDLSGMLGVELTEPEPVFKLISDSSRAKDMSTEGFPVKTFIYENPSASSDLTILIFRDSFTNAIIEFMKPHFKKIVLIWDAPYSNELINKVKPDIVVECYVTRYFR